MRTTLILLSIGIAASFAGASALAIGFGKVGNPTALGQPLDFFATVRLENDEVLERNCVFAEVVAGENRLGAEQVRVALKPGADPAERIVRVSTLHMIDEPVVTVVVTVGCASKVSRKFVAFLDPPVLNLASASEPRAAEPQRAESQVAPLLALVEPARVATRPPVARARAAAERRSRTRVAAAARAVRGSRPVEETAAAGRPAAHRVAGVGRGTSRPAPAGSPRLQLETAAPVVARAPETAASAVAAAAPAATAVPATPGAVTATADPAGADASTESLRTALAQERARIQALESGLARLRADAQATQNSIGALQARLHQAETERYANPLVYLLGGLCAILTLVAGFALQRGARPRTSRWWDLTQLPAAVPTAEAAPAEVGAVEETKEDAPWVYQPARLAPAAAQDRDGPVSSIGGLEVTTVIDHTVLARMAAAQPAANGPLDFDLDRAPHELSMDDLIDIEQQAEFFLVLGQDEAAVDLLARRTRDSASASPLPYFRLLQIHRRRGEEAAFARAGEAFHERFGAPAPSWDEPESSGRALDRQTRLVARLQAAWTTPAEAMQVIESALFRRDPADEMPDYHACRELVFLYSIARDLAEQPLGGAIDLLLPIDDEPSAELTVPVTPSHFAELYTLPTSRPVPLDLDISIPASLDDESDRRKAV